MTHFKLFLQAVFIISTIFLLLCSCKTTRKEFAIKKRDQIKKYCEMKMLDIPDSEKKRIKLKQCIYFRTENLYNEYSTNYEKKNLTYQLRYDPTAQQRLELLDRAEERKHEIDLKQAPTTHNLNIY